MGITVSVSNVTHYLCSFMHVIGHGMSMRRGETHFIPKIVKGDSQNFVTNKILQFL